MAESQVVASAASAAELRPLQIEMNGINVISDSERKGHPRDLFWPWFAANVSVLGLAYGAFVLGFGISFWQAVVVSIVGIIVSFLLCGFIAVAGKRGSAPTMVLGRAAFGVELAVVAGEGDAGGGDAQGGEGVVQASQCLPGAGYGRRAWGGIAGRSGAAAAVAGVAGGVRGHVEPGPGGPAGDGVAVHARFGGKGADDVEAVRAAVAVGVLVPPAAVVFDLDPDVVAVVDFGADGERATWLPGVAVQHGVRG